MVILPLLPLLAGLPPVSPLVLPIARPAGDGDEEAYYRIEPVHTPEGLVLEVGGIALLPDGRPLVCTRRGEVWVVNGVDTQEPRFTLFADGLHEPLGLLVHEGWIYVTQRGELSRMRDVDGDDRMDELETVCDDWRISGNYHEYDFGPRLDPEGNLWITLNRPFGAEPYGHVDWRGFAMRIGPDGHMEPVACGLRSPCGLQPDPEGRMFYTDNQGEWCGASKLSLLRPGSFHGHPLGLPSCKLPLWHYPIPPDPPNGELMPQVAQEIPTFELPAVWFPYDKMGRSPSGFVWDETGGAFGPFEGQVFVGDQYAATVMRVFLEEVDGHWQGACFPFRSGLVSGVVRVAWGADGALLVGCTDRGWGSLGRSTQGLDRLVWTGRTPFEVYEMHARPDGFELAFTEPVDAASAADPASYALTSYTYLLHETYGSPEVDEAAPPVTAATVAADGLIVHLSVDGLRAGYVHELRLDGVRSAAGAPVLHPAAYYTLIRIPGR